MGILFSGRLFFIDSSMVSLSNVNIYELSEKERAEMGIEVLPGSLKEAVDVYLTDPLLHAALGETLSSKFVESRLAEWEEYRMQVSDWEVRRYLEAI
jgi:Glutamine synthetase